MQPKVENFTLILDFEVSEGQNGFSSHKSTTCNTVTQNILNEDPTQRMHMSISYERNHSAENSASPHHYVTTLNNKEVIRFRAVNSHDGAGKPIVELLLPGHETLQYSTVNSFVSGKKKAIQQSSSVYSTIQGKIIAFCFPEGAHVTSGSTVALIEAMKMEHCAKCSMSGAVKYHCSLNSVLSKGTLIATISPQETDA